MTALAKRGIKHITLTLHVGAGTFLPVKVDDTNDHIMHAEWGEITPEAALTINATKAVGGRVVEAVYAGHPAVPAGVDAVVAPAV